ncbi:MAG: hypothetical protein NT154_03480 [Verrucomicrobia bacterium]|nr:hypothetical protein [Verrucomicrobiota bacterium]
MTANSQAQPEALDDPQGGENQAAMYRKVLLRIVFGALGLAAFFGAAGVIFAGHDAIWRIVGTCAATAGGALLMLGASQQLEKEATWLPGIMSVALIAIEYLAALGLIWSLFGSAEEPIAMTMLFLAATAIPAIGCSGILNRPDGMLSARLGLFVSVLAFGCLMVATWGGWHKIVQAERWHFLALWLAVFGVLAVVCLIGAGTDRRHWRWLGVAAAAMAYAMSAYAVIYNLHETSTLFVCVVSVAAVVAHANAMSWCPLKPGQRWLLWGTICAGIATGALVDFARITNPWQEEMLGRLAGASAIIGGCGTLALLVLARIYQRNVAPATIAADLREIKLTCPRCRTRRTLAIGAGECGTCGLIIEVRVREPESAQ